MSSHTPDDQQDLLAHDYPVFSFLTRRPVAVSMLVLAVMVFGWISFGRLPLTLMPDISYPGITLRTTWEGAAPEEMEQFISRPIEQAMGVVGDLVSISSLSRSEQSDVVITFAWNTDMDVAIQEVREKLEMVYLPQDVKRPLLLRYDPSLDPVLRLGLTQKDNLGDEASMRALRLLASETIKIELEKLPGVAAVKVRGGLEEEILIELNEKELSLRRLDPGSISRQLAAENVNLAGGNLKEGLSEYSVRVLSEYTSLDEIADTRLVTGDGILIRLGDIATIRRGARDPESLTRVNGRPAVELEIYKEADANVVRVSQRVAWRVFGPAGIEGAEKKASELAAGESSDISDEAKKSKKGASKKGKGRDRAWWLAGQLAPQGLRFEVLANQGSFIEASLHELKQTAIFGGLFAVLVLFLFLRNLPATGIVALAIPLSVVASFGPMQLAGLSLNVMSLGGLALGIGMLVDNAIVVLESIHRRRQAGDDRVRAAIVGTGEVGQAVTASTLTTLAVFFPMVFVEGVAGQIFGDLALVVVFSLSASLLLALSFIPTLSALGGSVPSKVGEDTPFSFRAFFLKPLNTLATWREDFPALRSWSRQTWLKRVLSVPAFLYLAIRSLLQIVLELLMRLISLPLVLLFLTFAGLGKGGGAMMEVLGKSLSWLFRPFQALAEIYPRLLNRVLKQPLIFLGLAGLLLYLSFAHFLPGLGRELMPEMHQGEFYVEVEFPPGTPLAETAQRLNPVEEYLRNQSEVASLAVVVGSDTQGGMDTEGGSHVAKLTIRLKPSDTPAQTEEALITRLRPFLERFPDMDAHISFPVLFSQQTPIEVLISGHDLDLLATAARSVTGSLSELPWLEDLQSTLTGGNPEVHVTFIRDRLARNGLRLETVAQLLRDKVLGRIETAFRDHDRQIDVRVRLHADDLVGLQALSRLVVNPGQAVPIPLSAVADLKLADGPAEIRRMGQQRGLLVRANLGDISLGDALAGVEEKLSDIYLPAGIQWEVVGQSREMEDSLASLYMALALAVFLVYVVMASQFESLLHPLIILGSIPLAFVGVLPVLSFTQTPISVVVFLGGIMLVGIVVNNAIILVDTVNQGIASGLNRHKALLEAGSKRLRPILMTTATTVLGLMPMALGLGEGAELRRPMALTVISGLLASTLLTLFVIPLLYDRVEQFLDMIKSSTAQLGSKHEA